MTTTPLDPRLRILDAAREAVAARMRADVELLAAAAEWAVMHPATAVSGYAGFGQDLLFGEALVPLAGPGAPLVAEFAPAELAATLGWSTETIKELMGDALELVCRLPCVWDQVVELRLSVPVARYAAAQTRDLDPETAHDADRILACDPGTLTRRIVKRVVDEIRLHADPDRAVEDERRALAARKVELRPGTTPATIDVEMSLDTADGEAFDSTVCALTESLRRLGETDTIEVLRARAVGIMADPQSALDLLHGQEPSRKRRAGSADLFLRCDLDSLAALAVAGIVVPVFAERHGVATTALIREWLTGWLGPDAKIVVKPFLDLRDPDSIRAVDGHDPTQSMADFVRLRDPHCVFPGCTRPSRQCDLDHIEPYLSPDDGGPPGQTHVDNLAPLCRHHHRVKTHGRWRYRHLPDGYRWTTRAGRIIDVPRPRHR